MAIRVFLPGRGAVSLDAEQASVLNVTIPELGGLGQVMQSDIDGSAVPKSYSDERDVRFYDATVTYAVNEYVLFNNRIWFANEEVTGVEPSSTATEWTELTRQDLFLRISDGTNTFSADAHNDLITFAGANGITTTASDTDDNDMLTIQLTAGIDNLSDVDTTTTTPMNNNVLQWNETMGRWVPADISGTGFSVLSADDGDDVTATSSITTIDVTGAGAVSTAVEGDADSANLTISVADGTASQAGLLPTADKMLLDRIDAGGYENSSLELNTQAGTTNLQLVETQGTNAGTIDSANLNNFLSLGNLSQVLDTINPRTDQVLQFDGSNWDAVTLQAGDYEFPTAAGSDPVILEPGDYFIQNRIRYLYTGVTGSGIVTRTVQAENTIDQSILNSTEFERVGLQTAYHTFPISLETFLYRGDIVVHEDVPYMYLGISTAGDGTVSPADSLRVPANTTIPTGRFATDFLTLDSGDTTYTLETRQNAGENVVSVTLDDNDAATTTDSFFNFIGGENITLERTDEGNIRITGVDVSTQHFPIYSSATLYELGDIIIYEFPRGSIQAADDTASPPIPPAPPEDAFLQVQFAGGTGAVPSGGRAAQEPIISGQTGINAVSRDWKIPANSISVFHPWLQYSVNSIVDYEGALYRSLTDVLRTSDGTPLEPPSASGTTDWTPLDITDAAVINRSSVPELNGVSRQLWDRFNRVAIGYPVDSTMPTGVDNTMDPVFVGPGANATNVRALIDAAEVTEPLRVWDNTTTYAENDQVIHDGGGNVFSIYVAEQENTNVTPSTDNGANWHLVRSGIVSVAGPDDRNTDGDIVPAGLTQNSTLSIQEGSGVNVSRNGTTFTISAHGSGHSDADDFAPGYRYSFYPLYGEGYQTGIVGNSVGGTTVDRVTTTLDALTWLHNGATLTAGQDYGMVISGTALSVLFPNYPAPVPAEGIIAYGYADTTEPNRRFHITQLDPAVDSTGTLNGYANASSLNPRDINATVTLFELDPDHAGTSYTPSIWARQREDGTDTPNLIPDAKLENVNQTVAVTRTDGATEELVFNVDGTSTLTLDTEPDVINDLDDVNLTAPTDTAIDQVLRYDNTTDPANPVWVNADLDLPIGSRFQFSTTDETSTDVEITGFITDNDLEAETFTTVRSAGFTGTGGRLQFELARFNSQLRRNPEFSFAASPAWDQPWSAVTSGTRAVVFVQSEDDLFPETHLQTLSTPTANVDIAGNPRQRGTEHTWILAYNDPAMVRPNSSTVSGGSTGEIEVTATSNQGGFTDTISSGSITWNDASLSTGNRTFTNQPRTFLETYPNYTWSMNTNNIVSTNSAVITAFNFNNGVTSATGNGINISDVRSGTDELAIGGVGSVTFTTTVPVYNNQSLAGDSIALEFRRPEAVTGTAYTVPAQTFNSSGFPSFSYPIFSFVSDSSTTIPDFVGSGTQHQTTDTRKTRAIGNLGINFDNTTGGTRYIWVAYPTGSPNVTRINVRTQRGDADVTNTLTLSALQRSSTDLTFINPDAGVPQSASENYKWFWVEVPNGDRATLLQTNP